MWNSLSSASRLLLRWATMLVQVTPVAVTAPVMTLGTTMTHQFTSTAAPYPGRDRSVASRTPPIKALGYTQWEPVAASCRDAVGSQVCRSITLVGTRCRPSRLTMPRPRIYAHAWRRWGSEASGTSTASKGTCRPPRSSHGSSRTWLPQDRQVRSAMPADCGAEMVPVVEKRRPLALLGEEADTDMCVHAVDLVENLTGDPGPVASAIRQGLSTPACSSRFIASFAPR